MAKESATIEFHEAKTDFVGAIGLAIVTAGTSLPFYDGSGNPSATVTLPDGEKVEVHGATREEVAKNAGAVIAERSGS